MSAGLLRGADAASRKKVSTKRRTRFWSKWSKARAKLGWRHKKSFDTLVADMVEADRITTSGSAVIATAELPRFLYANSNDWYRLCRTRVRRMFFRLWACRNLHRQGCSEDPRAAEGKSPDLRTRAGHARRQQCRCRPAVVRERIRSGHSRGRRGLSRRGDSLPARRWICRSLIRP